MEKLRGLGVVIAIVLLLSGAALAESTGDITQKGNDNEAAIEQRLRWNEALIQQVGDSNQADVLQRGLDHEATIGQYGDENQTAMLQLGCESIAISFQYGTGNEVDVTQFGAWYRYSFPLNPYGAAYFNIALITQTGTDNKAKVVQMHGLNEMEISQDGSGNEVSATQIQWARDLGYNTLYVTQSGEFGEDNVVTSWQVGADNAAEVLQEGDRNEAAILMSGTYQYVSIDQKGAENFASVSQRGSYNTSIVTQLGNGNIVRINQTSWSVGEM